MSCRSNVYLCSASLGIVTFLVFGSPHFGTMIAQVKRRWNGSGRLSTTGSVVKDSNSSDTMEHLISTQEEGLGHLNVSGENQTMSPAVLGRTGLSPALQGQTDAEAGGPAES